MDDAAEGEKATANPSLSADCLARRLIADVALQARSKPNRWVMLGDIVSKLGVSWQEAEANASIEQVVR